MLLESDLLTFKESACVKNCIKVQERDISGLMYFDRLAPLLKRLHYDGCL